MLEKVPLHPILFALFPILTAYTSLIEYVLPDEIVLPLVFNLSLCAILFGVWFAILRHVRRAAIVTSVSVLLIFTFDAPSILISRALKSINVQSNDAFIVLPYLVLAGLIISVFARSKSDYAILTKFLNIISIVLVIGNVGYVIQHEMGIQAKVSECRKHQAQELEKIKLVSQKNNPDIYYIILDAFGRTEALQEVFGYDNTPFINELEKRGFTVAKKSRSNYQVTILSLPSSLNIQYMDDIAEIMGRDSTDNVALCRMIQKNNVTQALKKIGYRFENMRSGYAATDYVPEADDNIGCMFGNIFHIAFARGTIFGPFQKYFDYFGRAARATRIYAIDHPGDFTSKPSPKFTLIHTLVPHPPFLWKADGTPIVLDQISLGHSYTKSEYIGQVKFIQYRVLELIDALQKDPHKKVIIIQGDHGSAFQKGTDGDPSDSFLNERFRILNAYYLPESDLDATRGDKPGCTVYDTITPVNSFRVIFNKYFDAKLPLLEDKLEYSPPATPFAFEDVTKRVKP